MQPFDPTLKITCFLFVMQTLSPFRGGEDTEDGEDTEAGEDGELEAGEMITYVSLCIDFSVSLSTNFNGVLLTRGTISFARWFCILSVAL